MLATVHAIIKNCLFKFVYQSPMAFLTIWEMVIYFFVMNKDLLMLCTTYSGLEMLLIQSSTSQICVFVDPWQLDNLSLDNLVYWTNLWYWQFILSECCFSSWCEWTFAFFYNWLWLIFLESGSPYTGQFSPIKTLVYKKIMRRKNNWAQWFNMSILA